MRLIIMAVVVLAVAGLGAVGLRPRIARAAMLPEGAPAPDFDGQMIDANQALPVSLSDFRGHKLILYFYPKDNTPGCTREACGFRDAYGLFRASEIAVLGCSVDSADSHAAFIRKYKLPFPLLLDPEHKIARAYGAENGIPILGLDRRITYVIGEDGRILKAYPDVDPATHATRILHDLSVEHTPTRVPTASPGAAVSGKEQGRKPGGSPKP